MLRIDSDGRESGEDSAGSAADGRGQNAFEPKFKSIHKLNHRDKGLFVERWDGIVQDLKRPVFAAALFPALAVVQSAARFRSRRLTRPLDGASDVFRNRWCQLNEFAARAFDREAMLVFAPRR